MTDRILMQAALQVRSDNLVYESSRVRAFMKLDRHIWTNGHDLEWHYCPGLVLRVNLYHFTQEEPISGIPLAFGNPSVPGRLMRVSVGTLYLPHSRMHALPRYYEITEQVLV